MPWWDNLVLRKIGNLVLQGIPGSNPGLGASSFLLVNMGLSGAKSHEANQSASSDMIISSAVRWISERSEEYRSGVGYIMLIFTY